MSCPRHRLEPPQLSVWCRGMHQAESERNTAAEGADERHARAPANMRTSRPNLSSGSCGCLSVDPSARMANASASMALSCSDWDAGAAATRGCPSSPPSARAQQQRVSASKHPA